METELTWRQHKKRYSSPRWRKLRVKILERDGYRCCSCGGVGRFEVDHVKPTGPKEVGEAFFNEDNLQTLCKSCHSQKTRRENSVRNTEATQKWLNLISSEEFNERSTENSASPE